LLLRDAGGLFRKRTQIAVLFMPASCSVVFANFLVVASDELGLFVHFGIDSLLEERPVSSRPHSRTARLVAELAC
jgi:hypothetical protein